MMREILFRGKATSGLNACKWVEGFFVKDFWFPASRGYGIIPADNEKGGYCEVYPKTVGQYTGLTDKNGKKIFEGDIVAQNWYDYDEPSDDSFGEVVFCEYDCSFSVMDIEKDGIVPLGRCHAYHWEAEVIGNIHDNPKLLGRGVNDGNL